MLTMITCCT